MPKNKRKYLVSILLTTWNSSRKSFTLRERASFLGLVSNPYPTTQWVKHTFIALQHGVSLALKINYNTVFASGKHKYLTEILNHKSISIKNSAYRKQTKHRGTRKRSSISQSSCGTRSTISPAWQHCPEPSARRFQSGMSSPRTATANSQEIPASQDTGNSVWSSSSIIVHNGPTRSRAEL